jgi:hypothetical protein
MKLPEVPAEAKYQWWPRLRSVPASFVSNRGETERFLYYDGSTKLQVPLVVQRVGPIVRFNLNKAGAGDVYADERAWRGMLVSVQNGRPAADMLSLFAPEQPWNATIPSHFKHHDAEVRRQFRQLLTDQGLSEHESQALIDCWDDRFFKTDGLRYLMILNKGIYHAFLPLRIRPQPQDLVRVGVVLTELPDSPADAVQQKQP